MAPFVNILYQMKNAGYNRKVTYYFGANIPEELFMLEKMKQFEEDLPNFKFVPVVNDPGQGGTFNGETGLVTQAVERNVKNASDCEGYLCGSPGMIDAAIEVFKKIGMKEDGIYYDKFA